MMAPGGVGVTGFPPRGTHPEMLSPTNPLTMFAFTDFSDPRWTFTRKYLALRQDARHPAPMKAGLFNERTWGAYFLDGQLFIKQYAADPAARYPDLGCSFEIFANGTTLELETVGPLRALAPGAASSMASDGRYTGMWRCRSSTDEGLDQVLAPLL